MKKVIIILISITCCLFVYSQDTINKIDATGNKQGNWVKNDQEGKKIYEGRFVDNHPAGTFRYYYPSGTKKAVSVFSDDGRRTHTITYFPNGRKLAEGNYINEKKDSLWKFYSEYDEALLAEEFYVEGVKDGISKTYYGGKGVSEIITWKKDVKEGIWEQYYPEGKLKLRGNYHKNEKTGPFKAYYSSGSVLYSGQYENGSAKGTWIYYDDRGTIEKKETYSNGLLIDTWLLHPDTLNAKEIK